MKYKKEEIYKNNNGVEYHFTHDYCIVIYGLKFRDVQGRDLTYTDYIFKTYSDEYKNSLQFIVELLTHFHVGDSSILLQLPPYNLISIFQIFMEKVLRGTPSRDAWMNNVYYLNGESFCNMGAYESIPMTEILQMVSIHSERIEKTNEQLRN